MTEWKDITTFSQSDKERKPTSFEAREGSLRITITCGHVTYKPEWVMHCHQLGFDTKPLPSGLTLEQVKVAACQLVQARLDDYVLSLQKIRSGG